jgi:hypothetical protein
MATPRSKPTTIASLRHRVALCSMRDVVEQGGSMELTRKEVAKCWAAIEPFRHQPNFMSPAGFAILTPETRQTHTIVVRAALGLDYTSAAWVYEERLKSPPRWYKVLGFTEQGAFVELAAHLVEKSDAAQAPKGDLNAIQSKVQL